jgi:hypothetical protein
MNSSVVLGGNVAPMSGVAPPRWQYDDGTMVAADGRTLCSAFGVALKPYWYVATRPAIAALTAYVSY